MLDCCGRGPLGGTLLGTWNRGPVGMGFLGASSDPPTTELTEDLFRLSEGRLSFCTNFGGFSYRTYTAIPVLNRSLSWQSCHAFTAESMSSKLTNPHFLYGVARTDMIGPNRSKTSTNMSSARFGGTLPIHRDAEGELPTSSVPAATASRKDNLLTEPTSL